ncbi:hypothetical protein TRIP_B300012 [uncultured Desulfatiglans sp.]|nr:hypothetical protein TRIP_B300012 [uncultured Desulfatiglans sp.]
MWNVRNEFSCLMTSSLIKYHYFLAVDVFRQSSASSELEGKWNRKPGCTFSCGDEAV